MIQLLICNWFILCFLRKSFYSLSLLSSVLHVVYNKYGNYLQTAGIIWYPSRNVSQASSQAIHSFTRSCTARTASGTTISHTNRTHPIQKKRPKNTISSVHFNTHLITHSFKSLYTHFKFQNLLSLISFSCEYAQCFSKVAV